MSAPSTLADLLDRLAEVAPTARHGDDREAQASRDAMIREARAARATFAELGRATGLSRARLAQIVARA